MLFSRLFLGNSPRNYEVGKATAPGATIGVAASPTPLSVSPLTGRFAAASTSTDVNADLEFIDLARRGGGASSTTSSSEGGGNGARTVDVTGEIVLEAGRAASSGGQYPGGGGSGGGVWSWLTGGFGAGGGSSSTLPLRSFDALTGGTTYQSSDGASPQRRYSYAGWLRSNPGDPSPLSSFPSLTFGKLWTWPVTQVAFAAQAPIGTHQTTAPLAESQVARGRRLSQSRQQVPTTSSSETEQASSSSSSTSGRGMSGDNPPFDPSGLTGTLLFTAPPGPPQEYILTVRRSSRSSPLPRDTK